MKAALYAHFQSPIQIERVPDPSPRDQGVVIQVKASGLCRSDWHGWMGHDPDIRLPHVPGHELAGTILELGKEVKNFKVGDRVTVPFVCGCGHCPPCQAGQQQICDHQSQPGFTHWGSFAEYVAIDYADTNLVKIPEDMEEVTAALLGCRFITAFRAIVEQGKVQGGQYVAIHGCGGVGLSAIMIAQALGAQVIAIDIKEASLALARKMGATFTINAQSSPDVVGEVRSLSQGGVHVSLDALGSSVTCYHSIANLRKRGKHIQVGLLAGEHHQPKVPMELVIAKELEILGSHGMQAHKYPEMLRMIQSGLLKPHKMIERCISLEEAPQALMKMDHFENKGVTIINTF